MTIPLSINNLDPDSHFYNDVRICNDECEYLNEQTFREKKGEVMGITDINFSMIHLNIRSTSKHLTEFESFNQSLGHAFDIIAFSETLEGARASTGSSLLCVDVGYKHWSNDRLLCAYTKVIKICSPSQYNSP